MRTVLDEHAAAARACRCCETCGRATRFGAIQCPTCSAAMKTVRALLPDADRDLIQRRVREIRAPR